MDDFTVNRDERTRVNESASKSEGVPKPEIIKKVEKFKENDVILILEF